MARNTRKTPIGGRTPTHAPDKDPLDATQPVQPQSPERPAPVDDPTVRLQNHNHLPRRDPSGARGQRDHQAGQTNRGKTRR